MYNTQSTFLRIPLVPQFYGSMFNTSVKVITFLTHEEFSILFVFVSFTLIDGYRLYNSCLFIYFTTIGEGLIISSFKHDLSFKMAFSLTELISRNKNISSWFYSLPKFCLDHFC